MTKMLTWTLFFALMATSATAQEKRRMGENGRPANTADFNLTAHVTNAFLVTTQELLRLDVTLDGKKLQLESFDSTKMLHLGDYKARVVKDDEWKSGQYVVSYDLLMLDGTHLLFRVVGESN